MRVATFLAVIFVAGATAAAAQSQPPPSAQPNADCPPGVGADPPTVGSGDSTNLSEKLAESKGIICPPATPDHEMAVPPPQGGEMRIIRPPGTPGGDPSVQPK